MPVSQTPYPMMKRIRRPLISPSEKQAKLREQMRDAAAREEARLKEIEEEKKRKPVITIEDTEEGMPVIEDQGEETLEPEIETQPEPKPEPKPKKAIKPVKPGRQILANHAKAKNKTSQASTRATRRTKAKDPIPPGRSCPDDNQVHSDRS